MDAPTTAAVKSADHLTVPTAASSSTTAAETKQRRLSTTTKKIRPSELLLQKSPANRSPSRLSPAPQAAAAPRTPPPSILDERVSVADRLKALGYSTLPTTPLRVGQGEETIVSNIDVRHRGSRYYPWYELSVHFFIGIVPPMSTSYTTDPTEEAKVVFGVIENGRNSTLPVAERAAKCRQLMDLETVQMRLADVREAFPSAASSVAAELYALGSNVCHAFTDVDAANDSTLFCRLIGHREQVVSCPLFFLTSRPDVGIRAELRRAPLKPGAPLIAIHPEVAQLCEQHKRDLLQVKELHRLDVRDLHRQLDVIRRQVAWHDDLCQQAAVERHTRRQSLEDQLLSAHHDVAGMRQTVAAGPLRGDASSPLRQLAWHSEIGPSLQRFDRSANGLAEHHSHGTEHHSPLAQQLRYWIADAQVDRHLETTTVGLRPARK